MSLVLSLPPQHPNGDLDDYSSVVVAHSEVFSVVVGDLEVDPGDLLLLCLLPRKLPFRWQGSRQSPVTR
jgi:hypothetical protein